VALTRVPDWATVAFQELAIDAAVSAKDNPAVQAVPHIR
jgi:hypothetical protein